jgi:hypothetical protein
VAPPLRLLATRSAVASGVTGGRPSLQRPIVKPRAGKGRYSRQVSFTPQSTLRDLIVLALGRLSGAGKRADVLAEMDRLFGGAFTAEDRGPVRTRQFEESWRNRASFERAHMVRDRLLVERADGIWELDRLGRERLDKLSGIPVPTKRRNRTPTDPLKKFAPKDSSDYVAHLAGRILVKSRAHEELVRDYGQWAQSRGFRPFTLHPRDLVLEHPGGEWLIEAKMLYDGNAAEAVRAAVGQLLDYQHFFYVVPGLPLPSLLALFSESIGGAYIKFLESLSIASVWRSADSWVGSSDALVAGLATRPAPQ